ncbi:hypothetical protein SO694_00051277 [Aureococcus anophagefferens]|uniref:Uncharacterized protein n=1 Tax=Aureococcus anophagefferens TaxID=44056 RepID=A0ABR1FYB1_AURAN
MFAPPTLAVLEKRGEALKRRSTHVVPRYMKPKNSATHHRRKRRPAQAHDEERSGRKKAPFMDEKQLERSLNFGAERLYAMIHDGYGLYDATLKACEEVNFKAGRDGNLAEVHPVQLAGWFDMMLEGRHQRRGRRRREKRKRRGPEPGSALETYLQTEEAKNAVEAPPRVAHRSSEVRDAMRAMLAAWREQVILTREQIAREAEALKEEMRLNNLKMAGAKGGKEQERRYYKWVCFTALKFYLRRRRIEKKRAARRARFQGAISRALTDKLGLGLPRLLGGGGDSSAAAAYGGFASLPMKMKLKDRGGGDRVSRFMNVVEAVRSSAQSGDPAPGKLALPHGLKRTETQKGRLDAEVDADDELSDGSDDLDAVAEGDEDTLDDEASLATDTMTFASSCGTEETRSAAPTVCCRRRASASFLPRRLGPLLRFAAKEERDLAAFHEQKALDHLARTALPAIDDSGAGEPEDGESPEARRTSRRGRRGRPRGLRLPRRLQAGAAAQVVAPPMAPCGGGKFDWKQKVKSLCLSLDPAGVRARPAPPVLPAA